MVKQELYNYLLVEEISHYVYPYNKINTIRLIKHLVLSKFYDNITIMLKLV